MPVKTNQQQIQVFEDNIEITAEIIVLVDTTENWISVFHSGNEFTMSYKNWEILVQLVEITKVKI